MRHLIIRHLLPLLCLVLASAAAAQPAEPSAEATAATSVSDADRAVELFRQGNELYKEDRYAEAAPLYEQAWALAQTYDIAANYGHTAYHVQDYRKAAELLAFALARWPQTGHTPAREAAAARLQEARQHVAGLTIEVAPAGAQVIVDGSPVGTAPLAGELFLEPGPHTIEAVLSGYDGATEQVEAQAGASAEITLTLKQQKGPAGPTGPSNGQGSSPMSLWPAVVGGGVALALAGVGIALLAIGGSQESDGNTERDALEARLDASGERCPAAAGCTDLETMYADADSSINASTGLFIGAGAAAAFAVAWAILYVGSEDGGSEPTASPSTAFDFTPLAGPSFVGAGASLRF